jgi:hypothetical protein
MADFSLTTLFVVPVGGTPASTGSTQNLTAGQVGFFGQGASGPYTVLAAGTIAAAPYFYVAQGRENTYLQGSKRSDKIAGSLNSGGNAKSNVTEWYETVAATTVQNQITDVTGWNVKCGDIVTMTLRAHSSYIDTLYFNGFTRSVTVQAPCCDCGGDPCDTVDVNALIDAFIVKLEATAPNFLSPVAGTGTNPDNISLSTFFTFTNVGGTTLRITGKALTKYGQPCDVAAFPWEYDRMYFRAFVYSGPATTADFIVADNCNIVANVVYSGGATQSSNYPKGTSDEVIQLEKNFYSYQAGYLKHLYRMAGYNQNFESYVSNGTFYNLFYIKFNEYDKSAYQWGDYIYEDSMVIVAIPQAASAAFRAILVAALGTPTTT